MQSARLSTVGEAPGNLLPFMKMALEAVMQAEQVWIIEYHDGTGAPPSLERVYRDADDDPSYDEALSLARHLLGTKDPEDFPNEDDPFPPYPTVLYDRTKLRRVTNMRQFKTVPHIRYYPVTTQEFLSLLGLG